MVGKPAPAFTLTQLQQVYERTRHRGVAFLGIDDPMTYPQNVRVGVINVSVAGTKIELVKGGLGRTEGPVAMADGSIAAIAEVSQPGSDGVGRVAGLPNPNMPPVSPTGQARGAGSTLGG